MVIKLKLINQIDPSNAEDGDIIQTNAWIKDLDVLSKKAESIHKSFIDIVGDDDDDNPDVRKCIDIIENIRNSMFQIRQNIEKAQDEIQKKKNKSFE